jgi:hypothetical protein
MIFNGLLFKQEGLRNVCVIVRALRMAKDSDMEVYPVLASSVLVNVHDDPLPGDGCTEECVSIKDVHASMHPSPRAGGGVLHPSCGKCCWPGRRSTCWSPQWAGRSHNHSSSILHLYFFAHSGLALFIRLIIRLVQLVFSVGTVFLSHKKSANSIFQPAYNSSRTGPKLLG